MLKRPSQSEPPPRARAQGGDGIGSLVLENVRCFVHARVALDAPVTVIIGQNGSGKTTIAEAIASLAYGDEPRPERFPRRRGAEAESSIRLLDARGEALARWSWGTNGERREALSPAYPVFAYGQYRTLKPRAKPRPSLPMFASTLGEAGAPPVPQNLDDALRRPKTSTLFDFDEYLLRDLGAYLSLLADAAGDRAARVTWARLRDSLPLLDRRLLGFAIVERDGQRFAAVRRGDVELTLAELSDGYRAMLSVVLDLAISYSRLFAERDDPLAGRALVVIDEVDLNLHPRWQRRVIDQLTALFPETRFVLTTHAPTVVQSAIDRGHAVIVLQDGGREGTLARRLEEGERLDLEGAEVDSVQEDSRLFNTPRQSTRWEEEEQKAASLRQKVEAGTATEADRARLLAILDEFQLLMAKEEERKGTGPLMSELARTQIAFLKSLYPKETRSARQRPAKKALVKNVAAKKAPAKHVAAKRAAKQATSKRAANEASKKGARRHGPTLAKRRQSAR